MGESMIVDYIKNVIASRGLRHNHVAEQIGMKPSRFSYLLNQKKVFGVGELFRLCAYLNLDINYIYNLYLSCADVDGEVG